MITESIRNRILNHMLAIAGYDRTVSHVRALPNWFRDYTMTTEQEAQWLEEGAAILVETTSRTTPNLDLCRAKVKMSWINLQWGLRVVPAKE